MRSRSATTATDVSSASSVPTVSMATVTAPVCRAASCTPLEQALAVGDRVRAQVTKVVVVLRGRGRDHLGAAQDGQLDDHAADPARAAVHEHDVAVARAGRAEGVHGRRAGEQQPGGRGPVEVRRPPHGDLLGDDDPVRVATAHPPRDDLVARGEPAHRRSDRAHDAGHLVPEAHGQVRGVRAVDARVALPVGRVDARRPDVDEHVAGAGLAGVDVDEAEDVRTAVRARDDGPAGEGHRHTLHLTRARGPEARLLGVRRSPRRVTHASGSHTRIVDGPRFAQS